jgi:CRP-like cAMP-binding protein
MRIAAGLLCFFQQKRKRTTVLASRSQMRLHRRFRNQMEEGFMGIDLTWMEEKVLLRKLDQGEQQLVDNLIDVAEFKAGDTIVEQGSAGGVLYLLRSGEADITVNKNGDNVRVATAKEASMFGEMTFLTGDVASATVKAKKDCVVYKLTRSGYSELMQKNQDIVFALFAHILVHAASVIRHMNEEHLLLQQYIMGRRV